MVDVIPGIGRRNAQEILGETVLNMERFPSAGRCASWARLCPGNNESGGKRLSGHIDKGNPWLRSALVEAAWAAIYTKNTYLSAQYHLLAARKGAKRAVIAVAHTILVSIYHMLKKGTNYRDFMG